jgi:hypothetical protein
MQAYIDGAPCARRGGETNDRQRIVIAVRCVTSEKHGHRGAQLNKLPATRTNGRPKVLGGIRMAGLVGAPWWPCVQERITSPNKRTIARALNIQSRSARIFHDMHKHTKGIPIPAQWPLKGLDAKHTGNNTSNAAKSGRMGKDLFGAVDVGAKDAPKARRNL